MYTATIREVDGPTPGLRHTSVSGANFPCGLRAKVGVLVDESELTCSVNVYTQYVTSLRKAE